MRPLVSVVMPVHNAAATVAEAVESIRAQTFDRWELLCLDDGSTDESAGIITGLVRQDSRIRLIELPRGGIVAALNRGLRESEGEFVARMDGDDLSLPRRLEIQIARLQAEKSLAVVGGGYQVIDVRGTVVKTQRPPIDPQSVARALARGNCLCHSSVVMRRSALAHWPAPYREQFPLAEDYDLWLRLAERSAIGNVPEVIQAYRRDFGRIDPARVVRQAVATVGARHAAEARRAGRGDPSESWTVADQATLEREGIPTHRIRQAARRALLSEARLTRQRGFRERSETLLRSAAEQAPQGEGLAARLDYAWRKARVLLP